MNKAHITLKNTFYAVIVILIAVMVWLFSALVSEQNIQWARNLNKPICQPPGWVFYPIWSILFIMIAASAIIVLNQQRKKKKRCNLAIGLFVVNAALNMLYSLLYFGMKNILLAFLELPILIASIILLIWCTHKISKVASYLLIPYLAWVCFAAVLTGITLFIN
ncbi:TspO/MBR family protein [Patescibacteria group bacterium]